MYMGLLFSCHKKEIARACYPWKNQHLLNIYWHIVMNGLYLLPNEYSLQAKCIGFDNHHFTQWYWGIEDLSNTVSKRQDQKLNSYNMSVEFMFTTIPQTAFGKFSNSQTWPEKFLALIKIKIMSKLGLYWLAPNISKIMGNNTLTVG